jgi:hypothetical protein
LWVLLPDSYFNKKNTMAVSLLDKLKFKINTNPPFKLKKSHKKKKKKSKTPSSPIASKKPTIAIPEAIPEKQLWEGSQDLLKQQASDHGNPSDNLAGTSILPTPTIPRVDLLGDLNTQITWSFICCSNRGHQFCNPPSFPDGAQGASLPWKQ